MKTICTHTLPPFYFKGWECYNFQKALEIAKKINPDGAEFELEFWLMMENQLENERFIVDSWSGSIYIVNKSHWEEVNERL